VQYYKHLNNEGEIVNEYRMRYTRTVAEFMGDSHILIAETKAATHSDAIAFFQKFLSLQAESMTASGKRYVFKMIKVVRIDQPEITTVIFGG